MAGHWCSADSASSSRHRIAQVPGAGGREGALVRARCKGCSYDAECSADYTADVHTLLCANHRSLRKKQFHALTFACALLLRSCRGNAAVIEAGLVEVRARTLHAVFAIDVCGVYVRIGMLCALSPLSVKYVLCVRCLSLNIVALSLFPPSLSKYCVCVCCLSKYCVCVLSVSILCVCSLSLPPSLSKYCVCVCCLSQYCVCCLSLPPFPLKILCVCVLSLSILCVCSLSRSGPHPLANCICGSKGRGPAPQAQRSFYWCCYHGRISGAAARKGKGAA